MSLLVVGSVAFDTVATPYGIRDDVLGGSASFFSVAASHFTGVRLVAVVGDDFPEEHVQMFRDHRIDTAGLERAQGRTFRWSGRYHDDMNQRDTLSTELGVFEDFDPKLPSGWGDTPFVFLGNIHPALQLKVLEQVRSPRMVACDTMNLWIDNTLPDLRRVLERVDLLAINDDEVQMIAEENNLVKAARKVRAMGPRWLIVKRGEYGALLFTEGRIFAVPAYPLEEVHDPTGAGDTFAGGFMGYLAAAPTISEGAVRRAMVMGSVMASYCVEDFSLDRLKILTKDEVEGRYEQFVDLTAFDID
jgi:sugar/nucleoside kinase (ribokinase family)